MDTTDAITRRIASYRPRLLTAEAWELAGPAVRAVLTAAAPRSTEDVKVLASSLCAFLASPCGWRPGEVPDLRALLSDAAIERFATQFTGPRGTRKNHVWRLQVLQHALAGVPRRPAVARRSTRRRPAPAPELLRAVRSQSSLPIVAALAERLSGTPLTDFRLEGLVEAVCAANVTELAAGTVTVDRGVLGTYLDAVDLQLMTEVVRATTPTNTRKVSQRQQLVQARADRAAYRRASQGPRAAAHPDMASLDPAVRSAIESYRPQRLDDAPWAALRPLTVQMVAGYRPDLAVSARNAATIVVPFLQWVWSLPDRPDPAAPPTALELLSSPLVETYASRELRHRPTASVSTARAVLRRCVRSLDADHIPVATSYVSIDPPYSPEQCEEFAALAMAQPTPPKERNTCFLVGLGLGAGLGSRDLRHVRRHHIGAVSDPVLGQYMSVAVVGGSRPRTVPIRRAYEPLVRRALELSATMPADALVLGRNETRHNVTVAARRGIVTARHDHPVSIEPHRLRTT